MAKGKRIGKREEKLDRGFESTDRKEKLHNIKYGREKRKRFPSFLLECISSASSDCKKVFLAWPGGTQNAERYIRRMKYLEFDHLFDRKSISPKI